MIKLVLCIDIILPLDCPLEKEVMFPGLCEKNETRSGKIGLKSDTIVSIVGSQWTSTSSVGPSIEEKTYGTAFFSKYVGGFDFYDSKRVKIRNEERHRQVNFGLLSERLEPLDHLKNGPIGKMGKK
ncbi:hypothetical protein NQ315_013218 [Exocentrus adspersus]|uniref:Uncharacterized protein n=1 Tax=Exocentrus adspersus TaxID=1586481 RepID=A0AAV8VD42_9CUCU|nr:hypothetical protein NQ315_013218 [Exocentrus adspersus]